MAESASCHTKRHETVSAVDRSRSGERPDAVGSIESMRFAKGHGTGNDFVILPDPDGEFDLTPDLVARLCDRHFGLGADGVLRVVRTAAAGPDAAGQPADWFMDYWNADGSVAEMCGNGVRVFAKFLLDEGLAAGPELAIATRAGIRAVRAEADGQFTVDMGPAVVIGDGAAQAGNQRLTGLAISVVPHEDSWKVVILTEGPEDEERCNMIETIADRLRS